MGDLSPEAFFLATSSAGRLSRQPNVLRHEHVGVWLGRNPRNSQDDDNSDDNNDLIEKEPGTTTPSVLRLTTLQTLISDLRKECLAILPPPYEFKLLFNLFFTKIDPIFPILQGENLDQHGIMESLALKQCICLVAALDPAMEKHLRLPCVERVLTPIEFRAKIAAMLKQSLHLGFIKDKMVLLQVCALMAMYVDKPGCSELSSHFCSQAVHHSQTLGLHMGWPRSQVCTGGEKSRRIFWCVWVLDRLNAATNGRPILIHKQDMDKRVTESFHLQAPSFKLMIRITQFLDETISLYRPQVQFPIIGHTQTFEELVEVTGALNIGNGLLGKFSSGPDHVFDDMC